MSIRSIGENTTTAPLTETNNATNNTNFASSTQTKTNMRGISFVTEQITAQIVSSAQPQQDGLQQEAQKLIEKHRGGWFGWLDNDALGKELAAQIGECPELAKAVFSQLGSGGKLYTAQAMLEHLTDEQLAKVATSAEGRQILSDIKQSFSDNIENQKSWGKWFASKEKVAADEQRIKRVDTTVAEAAKARQKTETQAVQNTTNSGAYRPVTEEQVRTIMTTKISDSKKADFEKNLPDYTQRLNETMQRFVINTPAKQAAFLATVRHESVGMTTMTEMPSNHASSRLKSKGRGIIQLTLDSNYKTASEYFGWGKYETKVDKNGKEKRVFTSWDLLDKPELAGQPDNAFPIAGWFWSDNKPTPDSKAPTPNSVIGNVPRADLQDFREASALVNSGRKNGDVLSWSDRLSGYNDPLNALGVEMTNELRQNLDLAIKQNAGNKRLSSNEPSFTLNK